METNKIDILLIEDNVNDAELTIRALKKNKSVTTVVHIDSGEEALDFVFCQGDFSHRNINDIPRLILLDLKMPRLDGIEFLRRLKRNEQTRMIPTVVLSSSKEDKDILDSYNLGANSYFVKPVDFEGFIEAISALTQYWLELNQLPSKI